MSEGNNKRIDEEIVQEKRVVKKKVKLKKNAIGIIILFVLLAILGTLIVCIFNHKAKIEEEKRITKLINNINDHYSDKVKVNKDTKLYTLNNKKYIESGIISKDTVVNLDKVKIDENTKYFKITDTDYYIDYDSVNPSKDNIIVNDRYKNYLLFNENVKTKNSVKLYKGDKVIYTLNKVLDLPIIKKDDNGYYVEYFKDLYLIKKEDVESTYSKNNTDAVESTSIPVTCNHFIYLEGDNTCNEMICHHENQIKEEFKYLRDNNYFTLTTTELREWMEGKIRLPEKSILITIDDGARAWNFIPLLEEYKVNATLFLITGWYDLDRFQSPYMELASHTHDLHVGGKCPGGQGSGLKCLPKNVLLEDLKKSRDKLNGTEAFCYPFYEFNDYSTQVIKEAGFKMAFIGGMKKVTKSTDLYHIPRISFNSTTTLNEYINWIK